MKTVFTNGRIILTDRILDGYSVIVEDGVISDVTKGNTAADKVVDLGGRYLAPGFIDMHTHGAGGHDFMDGTEEAIKGACMTHLSHGTYSKKSPYNTCTPEGVDECVSWGDYFYMEALTRLTKDWELYW